jgi:hypothetical protein
MPMWPACTSSRPPWLDTRSSPSAILCRVFMPSLSGCRVAQALPTSPKHLLSLFLTLCHDQARAAAMAEVAELTVVVVLPPPRLFRPSHHLYQHRYPILLLTRRFSELQRRRLWPPAWPQPPTRHAHVAGPTRAASDRAELSHGCAWVPQCSLTFQPSPVSLLRPATTSSDDLSALISRQGPRATI